MKGSVFVDTNVFVYAFDPSARQKQRVADALIRKLLASGEGVVSPQVMGEFINVATRRFAETISGVHLKGYVATVFGAMVRTAEPVQLIQAGVDLRDQHQFSWYDALIVAAALEARCTVLYSEDLQDGMKIGAMTIINPFR